MDNIYWNTDEPHRDNNETLCDFLENECPEWLDVYLVDGAYAEGIDRNKDKWEIHASGNGDFHNHMVSFKIINE